MQLDNTQIQAAIDTYVEELKKAAKGEEHNCDVASYLKAQKPVLWQALKDHLARICKDFSDHLICRSKQEHLSVISKLTDSVFITLTDKPVRVTEIRDDWRGMERTEQVWGISVNPPLYEEPKRVFNAGTAVQEYERSLLPEFDCALAPDGTAKLRFQQEDIYLTPEELAGLIVLRAVGRPILPVPNKE